MLTGPPASGHLLRHFPQLSLSHSILQTSQLQASQARGGNALQKGLRGPRTSRERMALDPEWGSYHWLSRARITSWAASKSLQSIVGVPHGKAQPARRAGRTSSNRLTLVTDTVRRDKLISLSYVAKKCDNPLMPFS